jgi:hypothetical protein
MWDLQKKKKKQLKIVGMRDLLRKEIIKNYSVSVNILL